jgi:hypothetical protein
MRQRSSVLFTALVIENSITSILANLLDISTTDSKTLSNKSTALSFKTKIDLLTDIKALQREDAKKFEFLMQLRNQFVHNIKAESFVSCFSYVEGAEKYLSKLYPSKELNQSDEERLKNIYYALFFDLNDILNTFFQTIATKAYNKGLDERNRRVVEYLPELASQLENGDIIIDLINKKIIEKSILEK